MSRPFLSYLGAAFDGRRESDFVSSAASTSSPGSSATAPASDGRGAASEGLGASNGRTGKGVPSFDESPPSGFGSGSRECGLPCVGRFRKADPASLKFWELRSLSA